jgi:hypothetical protein
MRKFGPPGNGLLIVNGSMLLLMQLIASVFFGSTIWERAGVWVAVSVVALGVGLGGLVPLVVWLRLRKDVETGLQRRNRRRWVLLSVPLGLLVWMAVMGLAMWRYGGLKVMPAGG